VKFRHLYLVRILGRELITLVLSVEPTLIVGVSIVAILNVHMAVQAGLVMEENVWLVLNVELTLIVGVSIVAILNVHMAVQAGLVMEENVSQNLFVLSVDPTGRLVGMSFVMSIIVHLAV